MTTGKKQNLINLIPVSTAVKQSTNIYGIGNMLINFCRDCLCTPSILKNFHV
jgi:hypothetical protein